MRIDAYTKAVLTTIAVALVWIAAGGPNIIPAVGAQDRTAQLVEINRSQVPLPVYVAGWVDRLGTTYRLPGPVQREGALERGIGMPTSSHAAGSNVLP